MVATLPGRTQGLGLITEPLLKDLQVERLDYASINLWATLLGAAFCLPSGYLMDRFGLRRVAVAVVLVLGLTVWRMSTITSGWVALFILVTLTRALGQSALSVVSITVVGKSFGTRVASAMATYSVLLSIFFAVAFVVVGNAVRILGWRTAWFQIAIALVCVVAPLVLIFLRERSTQNPAPASVGRPDLSASSVEDFSLTQALRTRAFWIFGGTSAAFSLVSSGLGLFNEAVLAEHGFNQKTYITFLTVTTLVSLLGQFLCGWLSSRWSSRRLMGAAMFLYAIALAILPFTKTFVELWILAVLMGGAGGIVIVTFFAVWSQAFGRAHLGRIQGAAQILTVLASAIGPLLFAKCATVMGSYTPLLLGLAPAVLLLGLASWNTSMPKVPNPADTFPRHAAT
jgi:MFS family permease